jgi:hypothetical protein
VFSVLNHCSFHLLCEWDEWASFFVHTETVVCVKMLKQLQHML